MNYDFDISIQVSHRHYTNVLPEETRMSLSLLARSIENKIKPYIPQIYHNQFQHGKMVMHDQLKTFAYKLNIADLTFHFVATDRVGVGIVGFVDYFLYTIELTDEETYEKHLKVMNKQINQIQKEQERERLKKEQEKLQQEEYTKELSQLKEQEKYRIYYLEDGSINYVRTPIQALEKKGLI